MTRSTLLAAALLALGLSPALAQVPMAGVFTAEATCPATPSIREVERNPGNILTEAGESYALLGRNAIPGSHYLIRVPGAEPERRWVAYGCGRVGSGTQIGTLGEAQGAREPGATPGADLQAAEAGRNGTPSDRMLLAVSWQPAFCETRPRVRECRDGGRDDRGFSLHGLWPQPRGREYCDVPSSIVALDEAGDWTRLPPPSLSRATRGALEAAMPGVASGLDRHEWWKHGTCFRGDAERYFAVSLRLLAELNASEVRTLFEGAVGKDLSARGVRESFDRAFGAGAGARVTLECAEADGRRLLRELRIELFGPADATLAELMAEAPEQPRGCAGGEVDAAGF